MITTLDNRELCKLIKDSLRSPEAAEILSFAIDQIPEIKAYLSQRLQPYYNQALPATMRAIKHNIYKFHQYNLIYYGLNTETTDCNNPNETARIRKLFINWVVKILRYDCYDVMTKKYRINYGYGSLVRASTKYLEEALSGLQKSQISQYLIVYSHLKEMQHKLPRVNKVIQEPTSEQLIEIAQHCDKKNNIYLSPQEVKEILGICIKALANKDSYKEISLDQLLNNQIEDKDNGIPSLVGKYLVDSNNFIPQPPRESIILSALLGETIEFLNKNSPRKLYSGLIDKIFILSYGFVGITQSDTGRALDLKQFEVSRTLSRSKNYLIKELTTLAKQQGYFFEALVEEIDNLLAWYYRQHIISNELENALRSHSSLRDGINTLMIYFSQLPHIYAEKLQNINLSSGEVDKLIKQSRDKINLYLGKAASKLGMTDQELLKQVDSLIYECIQYLSNWLQERFNINIKLFDNIENILCRTVYIFLCNAPYASLIIN